MVLLERDDDRGRDQRREPVSHPRRVTLKRGGDGTGETAVEHAGVPGLLFVRVVVFVVRVIAPDGVSRFGGVGLDSAGADLPCVWEGESGGFPVLRVLHRPARGGL